MSTLPYTPAQASGGPAGGWAAPPGAGSAPALVAAGLVLLAAGSALVATQSPPATVVLWGGVAALAALGVALWRYELLVAVALLTLGAVRFEPAPVDGVVAVLVAVALVTGRLDLRRVPALILVLVGALIAVNVVSAVAVEDVPLAVEYFAVTLYLAVFAVWLCSYLDSGRRVRLVVGAYVAGATISALLGSVALVLPIPGLPEDLFVAYGTRATGFFQDPNVFGPFLIPAALIMLEEVITPRLLRLGRPLSALLFAILTIGILLSYSRAAWLNLVVGVLLMVLLHALRGGGRTLQPDDRRARGRGLRAGGRAGLHGRLRVPGGARPAAVLRCPALRRAGHRDGHRGGESAGRGPGSAPEPAVPVAAQRLRARARRAGRSRVDRPAPALRRHVVAVRRRGPAARAGARPGDRGGTRGVVRLLSNSVVIDTLHWRHLWLVAALAWAVSLGARRSGRSGPAGRPA